MPQSTRSTVHGLELLKVLYSTAAPVKMICNGFSAMITPDAAMQMVRSGSFMGRCNHSGRVISIRENDFRKQPACDPRWWFERAVLRYHDDRRSIDTERRNRETMAAWESFFMYPLPAEWTRRV